MSDTRSLIFVALFSALIIVGGYLIIPLGPIPMALADFFIMLAGLCLGGKKAAQAVGFFLFLGAINLPVFAGGKGGFAVLWGPTGGFLWGYLLGAAIIGYISHWGNTSPIKDCFALLSGNLIIFLGGIIVFKLTSGIDWIYAITTAVLPFLPGNIIKIIAAMILIKPIRKAVDCQN